MNLKRKQYDNLIKNRKNSPAIKESPDSKVKSIRTKPLNYHSHRKLVKPNNSELRKSVPVLEGIKNKIEEDNNLS